jgi:hypothetical protein
MVRRVIARFPFKHSRDRETFLCSRFPAWSIFMDLNYLLQRYSVSLHMAENAGCDCSRLAHRELAVGYAAKIADAKLQGRRVAAR